MSASRTVQISGVSPTTNKEGLSSFIGFCGTIESIELDTSAHEATVVFAKESAAKTASLLNGGTLDGSQLTIVSPTLVQSTEAHADEPHHADIAQEHKPRSAIVAEMLAHGYHLSDLAVAKAIELDNEHGISKSFLNFFRPLSQKATSNLKTLDEKAKITEKAADLGATADQNLKLTETKDKAVQIGKNYYESALRSSVGSKVNEFYTVTAKQVQDVHEEARRIADSRKPATPASTTSTSGQTLGQAPASTIPEGQPVSITGGAAAPTTIAGSA